MAADWGWGGNEMLISSGHIPLTQAKVTFLWGIDMLIPPEPFPLQPVVKVTSFQGIVPPNKGLLMNASWTAPFWPGPLADFVPTPGPPFSYPSFWS